MQNTEDTNPPNDHNIPKIYPLRATHVTPTQDDKIDTVDLSDLVEAMRGTVGEGDRPPMIEMLGVQAHLMNIAFNRMIVSGTSSLCNDPAAINAAIRVQRRCHETLKDLDARITDKYWTPFSQWQTFHPGGKPGK